MILCRVFLEWLPAIGQYSANKIYFSLRWRKSESLNSKGEKFILSAKDNSFCGDKNPTHLGYFYLKKFWLTWLTGWLITWVLQKSSSLIGQLATVHNCDWLLKKKRIYKLSSISPWSKRSNKGCPKKTATFYMYNWQQIFSPQ